MASIYDPIVHTSVCVRGFFQGQPKAIVHKVAGRVWLVINYDRPLPEGAVPVGDGLTNGYDGDGARIISVPDSLCDFYTDAEAEVIEDCIEIDQEMLANAR